MKITDISIGLKVKAGEKVGIVKQCSQGISVLIESDGVCKWWHHNELKLNKRGGE